MSEKAPWYARMIGIPLVLFAVSNGIGFVLLPRDQLGSSRDIALNVLGSFVAVTAGVGLLMSRRWGWGLALAASFVILGTGLVGTFASPDIAFPGAELTALVFLVLPSLAGLAALLAPPTRRWVLKQPRPSQSA